MKNYEIQYIKGHLIDKITNKRIFLKRGGTFNILGDDNQFEEEDELQINSKPLSASEKLTSLSDQHKGFYFEKLAEAGTSFIFRIGLAKRTIEDKESEFLFNAVIQEDLYIMSKNGKIWNLCACLCFTSECLDGAVQMIEPTYGVSLSNLFSNVVTFYFSFQRSTACNAFTTFYFSLTANPKLYNYKSMNNIKLDIARKKATKKYEKI